MATTTAGGKPPLKPRKICFSFAAYSKTLVSHLRNSNIPIADGLTEPELSATESKFNFSFPPDLRSILHEGLPVGPGFPNWRSSSPQQLEILTNLPVLGICKEVYRRRFWLTRRWGPRPHDDEEAVRSAKRFLKRAPVLVPIYRNCYIPCTTPCLAGNPVFYVDGIDVKLWSYDVVAFFQRAEFKGINVAGGPDLLISPAWAATEARKIEFWTELAEDVGGETAPSWWQGNDLGRCLEEVWWKLRNGGWKEVDVTEMMSGGGDDRSSSVSASSTSSTSSSSDNREGVEWHVRELSLQLLRAGWSRGDVVDSLGGFRDDLDDDDLGESLFDSQLNKIRRCDEHRQDFIKLA